MTHALAFVAGMATTIVLLVCVATVFIHAEPRHDGRAQ